MVKQYVIIAWLTRKPVLALRAALWTSLILHLSSYAHGTVRICRVQLFESGHLLQIAALQQAFQTSRDRLARRQCRAPIASLYTTTISQTFRVGEPGGVGGWVVEQLHRQERQLHWPQPCPQLRPDIMLLHAWAKVLSCASTPGMLCSSRNEARKISTSAALVLVFLSASYMSVLVAKGSTAMNWSKMWSKVGEITLRVVPSALQHTTFNHYYALLPILTKTSLDLKRCVEKLDKIFDRRVVVKWTYQTELLGKRIIPELEEERIILCCLAVSVILLFASRCQWVGSLHSFTRRWIIPVHTTNMGKPFPYFATEFVIHSTLVSWSPWLLLSLWLAWQCISSSISTSRMKASYFWLPLESTHLQCTCIIITYHYISLHIIIVLPVQNTLTCCESNLFAVQQFRRSSLVRKISMKLVLGLLKNLGAHHNILRICEGCKPHGLHVLSVCFNFAQVWLRKAIWFNNFEYFKALGSIVGFSLIQYIVPKLGHGNLEDYYVLVYIITYVIMCNNEVIITFHNT